MREKFVIYVHDDYIEIKTQNRFIFIYFFSLFGLYSE